MEILENAHYCGSYIGQHKIGKKSPECDGYKGSGSMWKKYILSNHIPVKKTIIRVCDDIAETNYWEMFYIEQALQEGEYLWNIFKGGGGFEWGEKLSEEELRKRNKERFQKWYADNQTHIKEYRRKYYQENKESRCASSKKYQEDHRDYYTNYAKNYYQKNKTDLSEKKNQYYVQHKEYLNEHMRDYGKVYRSVHAEQETIRHKQYYENNKDKRDNYYCRLCLYEGKTMTFRALILRLRRKNISNPTEIAKQYLI